ncbi:Serine/threonine protein kinase [Eubacterium ruminantium]|nr:Serine/threonine protein kinase [Eubacterium ruminantium]
MVSSAFALPMGTKLNNRYIVTDVLGNGGFGITYEAKDMLNRKMVAIKELYPKDVTVRMPHSCEIVPSSDMYKNIFNHSKERFADEAMLLYKFNQEPQIVSVFDFFMENGTCYFAMERLYGKTLNALRKEEIDKKLSWEKLAPIIKAVGEALNRVHSQGVFHRDIGPDNIFIQNNGSVKLIDFGNAKSLTRKDGEKLSVYLKPGFAPMEQYATNGKQGTWTDVYSLAATIYFVLTSIKLKDPMTIMSNGYQKLTEFGIRQDISDAVDKALAVNYRDRTQTITEFLDNLKLNGGETVHPVPPVSVPVPPVPTVSVTPFVSVIINNRVVSQFRLNDNTGYTIGRVANIVVDERHVSKTHLLVMYNKKENQYYVEDYSSNGSYIGMNRLTKGKVITVPPGTFIYLGGATCQVELGVFYG